MEHSTFEVNAPYAPANNDNNNNKLIDELIGMSNVPALTSDLNNMHVPVSVPQQNLSIRRDL